MNHQNEIWITVPSFCDYEVSSEGRFRRISGGMGTRAGKIIKPYKTPNGYHQITFSSKGIRYKKLAHRVVLEAFCGSPPVCNMDCAHNNGIRTDNRISNLRWATRAENVEDSRIHGTIARGERNGHAKLTTSDVLRVRELRSIGRTYQSIADEYGVAWQTIQDACSGRNWEHIPC